MRSPFFTRPVICGLIRNNGGSNNLFPRMNPNYRSVRKCITLQRNSKQIRLGQSTFLSLQENLERERENFLCPSTKTGQFVAHELKTWSHRKKKGFCPQGKNPCSLISAHISGPHLRNTLPMLERVLLAAARIRMRFKLGRPVEKQVLKADFSERETPCDMHT